MTGFRDRIAPREEMDALLHEYGVSSADDIPYDLFGGVKDLYEKGLIDLLRDHLDDVKLFEAFLKTRIDFYRVSNRRHDWKIYSIKDVLPPQIQTTVFRHPYKFRGLNADTPHEIGGGNYILWFPAGLHTGEEAIKRLIDFVTDELDKKIRWAITDIESNRNALVKLHGLRIERARQGGSE